jgi:PPOX class probable F420-dependent enzyme
MLDLSSDLGQHALARLANEHIIWLTTIGADGAPQPNPVWFLWDENSFLIYTQPGSRKAANLRRNPRVSLHFNSDPIGDDIVVFTGEAQLDAPVSPASKAAYLEKYREGIERIDMTPETMLHSYSLAIRIAPKRLRGF